MTIYSVWAWIRRSDLVRVIFGLALISILILRVDIKATIDSLTQIEIPWLLLAFLVQLLGKVIWALRWDTLQEIFDQRIGFWGSLKAVYVGIFFNHFLPSGFGGDLYRGYWILDDKSKYGRSMSIIMLERLIGLSILGMITLPVALWYVMQRPALNMGEALIIALAGIMALAAAFLHPGVVRVFGNLLKAAPGKSLSQFLERAVEGLISFHSSGVKKWIVYACSLGTQLVGILFYTSLGKALGLPLQTWHYFIIVPITVVAASLPLSLNGLGIREGMLVLLVATLTPDVPQAQALALGLLATGVSIVVSLAGAAFYIAGRRREAIAS